MFDFSESVEARGREFHGQMAASWEALGEGAPTLAALAGVCARSLLSPPPEVTPEALSPAAQTILFAARERGVIEVRGVSSAFEAPARMLAVYVEEDDQRTIAFRDRERPEVTMKFFEGFCQLCRSGLVMHHLHRDFTLTERGFQIARQVVREEIADQLGQATDFGLHE